MNETKFVLHTDCDYPCIHLEVYLDNELVSNTEIDIVSQLKYLDTTMINDYNSLLNISFNSKCEEIKESFGNSLIFRDKTRELEYVQNKKRVLDLAIQERDNNV